MSAADEALAEWQAEHNPRRIPHRTAAFMAGYRRALEDAAATPFAEEAGVSWEDCDPETGDQVIYRESMREFLTARAAAVAPDPRETKD